MKTEMQSMTQHWGGRVCLVTGGAGFTGAHLCEQLLARGARVCVFDRQRPVRSYFVSQGLHDCTDFVFGDVRELSAVRCVIEQHNVDTIFHLAGQASLPISRVLPLETLSINALGTYTMLEAARLARGVEAFVYVSSGAVYGMRTAGQLPVGESSRCEPVDMYGASKLAAELATRIRGRRHDISTVVARIFNVVGPGQDDQHVCGRFVSQLCAGSERIHVRNLETSRDFTDVRDVATALVRLGEKGECGTTYNVASGKEVYISEVLRRLIERTGFVGEVVSVPSQWDAVDVPRQVADISRLRALGFEHKHALGESLHDLVTYYCTATLGALGSPHEGHETRQ